MTDNAAAGHTAAGTGAGRRWRLTSPVTALVLGGLVLAALAGDLPLASLAHQPLDASGGSVPVWISAGCAVVGFLVAYRRPRNPLGWVILGVGAFFAISEDASFYLIADYRWIGGALALTVQAIATHLVAIDSGGNLTLLTKPGRQVGVPRLAADAVTLGLLALPATMGVAIMRYRLFDIDRIISRTLSCALITGLLVGVYAGTVLLATKVVAVTGTVAVAVSTLVAAALFSPVRRRVQQLVDRRFNRTRYDADHPLAAFAARLNDAVDLDEVGTELTGVVRRSLEPALISLWIRPSDG